MQIIDCNDYEFEQIENGTQIYKLFNDNYNFKFLEKCILKNSSKKTLNVEITGINKYNDINDMLKVIDLKKFGKYESIDEFIKFNKKYNKIDKGFIACRIKNLDEKNIEILDEKLLELIDTNTLDKFNLGLSGCQVFKVKMKNNNEAILKIQPITSSDSLKEEYDALKKLYGKISVAEPYYYNKIDDYEYLLRECIEGEPLYKFHGFGYKLGRELKEIHNLYSKNFLFSKFNTDNLLKHALDNIDAVYQTRDAKFKNYNKEDLIKFLKDNQPVDDALIHGDFSLTNILVYKDRYYYIDLGNVSISTKYFDLYVFKKTLKINNLEDELKDFLKGYGLDKLDDRYMDWMSLIEKSFS